jgi:L-alanine-DL-glutamate epimerase-like enolase superfamily enzyme
MLKFDLDVFETERAAHDMRATTKEIGEMADRCIALREAVGNEIGLAFDCHWRFDVPTAMAVSRAVEPASPMWLEDVVPPDPRALAAVNRVSPVPLASGENTYLVEGFRPLIEYQSVSIVTPDAQKTGGLYETKRILDDARLAFLQGAPHCVASPLGVMATAHVAAACSNVLCIEFHGADVPFWHNLVDRPVIENGLVTISESPGFGVELDEEVVRQYSRKGQPVFELSRSASSAL